MTKLTEIANKHFTDKGTVAYEAHGYTEEYAKYIPEKGKFTLLEIGVWHGDSLRMWREYNPELTVVGIDIDPNSLKWVRDGEPLWHIGDASDRQTMDEIAKHYGEFDFIIDDGSHTYRDITLAFVNLFPNHLKSNGIYFIEDLHAPHALRGKLVTDINLSVHTEIENVNLVCNDKLLIIRK